MERLGNLVGNLVNWLITAIIMALFVLLISGTMLYIGQVPDQRIGFDEPLKYEVVETTDGVEMDTVYYYTIPGVFNR